MCSQTIPWLCLRKPLTYTAAGNETRPAKVQMIHSSCWEVRWHSWIGFASKASFAQHIDISMVAQFELEGILGRSSSFHFSSNDVHPLQYCKVDHTFQNTPVAVIETCISYSYIEIALISQSSIYPCVYVYVCIDRSPVSMAKRLYFCLRTAPMYAE